MRRRELFKSFCGAAVAQAIGSLDGRAARIPTIGIPFFYPPSKVGRTFVDLFNQGLKERGYDLTRDLNIQARFANGDWDHLPLIVDEILRLRPDVIYTFATLEAVAVRKATSTIPIVCAALADAVHLGLIASEARPGGNVTGIEPYVEGLPAKQIDLAREVVNGARVIGILANPKDPKGAPQAPELVAGGRAVGLTMIVAEANRVQDINPALKELADRHVDVVITAQTSLLLLNAIEIAETALALRLPMVFGYREHVTAGGLLSYGVDLRWVYPRSAYFVDKILRGSSPQDMPIEFPTTFPLSVNLKTAKALGLNLSTALLARADEVIE